MNPSPAAFRKIRVAHLIFNPVAGQGRSQQELHLIRQTLEPALQLQIHVTTPEVDADTLAERAIAQQPDLIIASGGDGTISLVASKLIGTGILLAIIPRGTANALSVALGIPTNPKQACELILTGMTRRLDAAYCNQQLMILLAGIGFEASMVSGATRELKNQWGTLAYLVSGWQQLGQQHLFQTELEVDGEIYRFQAAAITIANAAPPTSVLAQGSGQVDCDDGALDITIITPPTSLRPTIQSRLESARYLMQMFGAALAKTPAGLPSLYHFQAQRLKITTDPPEQIVVDGELIGTTPLEVECLPAALTVCAPAEIKPSPLEKLAFVWARQVSPNLSALIATIGVGGLGASLLALWGVQEVTTRFLLAQTKTFDTWVLLSLHQWANPWVDQLVLRLTALGSPTIVIPIAIGFSFWLGRQRLWWAAQIFALACAGTLFFSDILKLVFARPRPNFWPTPVVEPDYSYPSSYGLGGVVFLGMLAYILAIRFPAQRRWLYSGAIALVIAIGVSRLYLGIVWPSDLLASWFVGFLWLMACIVMLRLRDIRRHVKQQQRALLNRIQHLREMTSEKTKKS